MTREYRKRKWRERLRPYFIGRAFPPRVVRDLERLDIQVDSPDRDALLAGKGLFLHGGVGSGKTVYAAAALTAVARHRYVVEEGPVPSVCLVSVTQLLRGLRDALGAGEQEKALVDQYGQGIGLLALDDLGTEKASEWTLQVLHEIINERYERLLPVIVTTNANGLDGLAQFLGDARIPSRLGAMCRQRDFGDRDYRPVIKTN